MSNRLLNKAVYILAAFALLLGIALRLHWLHFRPVFVDESQYVFLMVNFLEKGQLAPTFSKLPDHIPIYPYWGYSLVLYGFWAQIFGAGILQARSLNFIAGLLMLPLVFLAARYWFDTKTALISTALLSLQNWYLHTVVARNNALVSLIIAGGLLLHIYAVKERKPVLHLILGLYTWIMLESHVIALTYAIGWGGYYLVMYVVEAYSEKKILFRAPLWYFVLGSFIGVGLYIMVRMYVYGLDDFILISQSVSESVYPVSNEGFLRDKYDVFVRRHLLSRFLRDYLTDTALLIIICGLALIRRKTADIHWLLIMVFAQVGYFIFDTRGHYHYTIFGLPLFWVTSGALVTYGLRRRDQLSAGVQLTLLAALLVPIVAYDIRQARQNHAQFIQEQEQWAEALIILDEQFEAGSPVLSHKYEAALLPQYDVLISSSNALVPAATFANQSAPEYWAQQIVEQWPQAVFAEPGLTFIGTGDLARSYWRASHGTERAYGLIVNDTEHYVRNSGDLELDPDLPIQLIAYDPDAIATGSLETIWLIREQGIYNGQISVRLFDSQGGLITEYHEDAPEGRNAFTFHRISISIPEIAGADSMVAYLEVEVLLDDMSPIMSVIPIDSNKVE